MDKFKTEAKKARAEVTTLKKTVESYQNIQTLIKSESHDIESTIKNFAENSDSFSQITTSYVFFKKEYDKLKEAKRTLENQNKTYRRKVRLSAQQFRKCCDIFCSKMGKHRWKMTYLILFFNFREILNLFMPPSGRNIRRFHWNPIKIQKNLFCCNKFFIHYLKDFRQKIKKFRIQKERFSSLDGLVFNFLVHFECIVRK